jgi:hypothetical protein
MTTIEKQLSSDGPINRKQAVPATSGQHAEKTNQHPILEKARGEYHQTAGQGNRKIFPPGPRRVHVSVCASSWE